MNTNRLLRLAQALRNTPPPNFHLYTWVQTSQPFDVKHTFTKHDAHRVLHECGTTACAVGLATLLPEFRREGLNLCQHDNFNFVPIFKDQRGALAVGTFFGIPQDDVNYLFMDFAYPAEAHDDPEYVADRIERFVQSGGLHEESPYDEE